MKLFLITLAALLVGFAVTTALTPYTVRLAERLGMLDHPDAGRKAHRAPTPFLGGLAIGSGLVLGAGGLTLFAASVSKTPTTPLFLGVVVAFALGGVGLIDDIRPLPRWFRLLAQLLAAIAAWGLGFRVLATAWPAVDIAITLLWIVGITNAFNLLDNIDGLTAGLAGVSCVAFAAMGLIEGLAVLGVVAAALAGSSFGFLRHNRHPAKVFMGDGGSLLLGFLIALIGVKLRFDNIVAVTFLVPVVVLGLPIFDTTLVVLSRLRHGRSPFEGARDHVSHRLVALGLPVRTAVLLLYWSAICLGWLGLVISRSNIQVSWMLSGFVLALGIFFGRLLWQVPVDYRGGVDLERKLDTETPTTVRV